MRVTVDPDICQGHGLCIYSVPDVFVMNELEHAVVQIEVVPQDLEDAVYMASVLCPEEAIVIHE